jgi:hypothetical protein
MSTEPLLTTDQIITIALALIVGIGGSLATLFLSNWRENRRENETAKRARALIVAELETVRNHLQHWLYASKGDLDFVPMFAHSVEVEYSEHLIANLQYLALDVDIKLKAFKPDEIRELHGVYTQIKTMKVFRTIGTAKNGTILHGGNPEAFVYKKADLQRWVEAIDKVIELLE